MVWVTISGAGVTTATRFFGDAMNKISNLFNDGVDIDTVQLDSIFEVTDTKFKIRASGDETKEIVFDVSAIATATTRTITWPDNDVDLGTVAFLTNTLGDFASTTSAQLLAVISNETGGGALVFGTSPTIVTPTIASFTNAQHNHSNAAGGGTFVSTNLSDSGNLARITTTNIFGNFDQQFFHDRLRIQNIADTFDYVFQAGAIVADRNITLPLLIGDDTFMFQAHIQNVTNKVFAGTTNKFEDDALIIRNPANTFDYLFQSSAIGANRTINLPIFTGDITLGDRLQALQFTIGDETTVLGTGTEKLTFRIPFDFTITEARCSTAIAGTGAALLTVDINDDTTSIFSTVLTQDATEKTSVTADTPAVLTSTPLAVLDNSEMTVDIDTIDTDNVAAGLKITLIGYKTP